MTRKAVYQEHHLLVWSKGDKTEAGSSSSRKEREKRTAERGLYMELSRYHPRTEGRWKVPALLSGGDRGRLLCTGGVSLTDSLSVLRTLPVPRTPLLCPFHRTLSHHFAVLPLGFLYDKFENEIRETVSFLLSQ